MCLFTAHLNLTCSMKLWSLGYVGFVDYSSVTGCKFWNMSMGLKWSPSAILIILSIMDVTTSQGCVVHTSTPGFSAQAELRSCLSRGLKCSLAKYQSGPFTVATIATVWSFGLLTSRWRLRPDELSSVESCFKCHSECRQVLSQPVWMQLLPTRGQCLTCGKALQF